MNLTVDNNSNECTIFDPDWREIEHWIEQIDPKTNCYLIWTANTGSYIQCAGSKERLTIEMREWTDNTFKHYVLGRGAEKSPLRTIWDRIECRVRPNYFHDCEVLSKIDALINFKAFHDDSQISAEYKKRNVTRLHQK